MGHMGKASTRGGLLHGISRRVLASFCRHPKLVYPPPPDYEVCFNCGKMRLRDPFSGRPYGEWSDDPEALRAAQAASRKRAETVLPLPPKSDRKSANPGGKRRA